jgi:hypothetical protein
MRTSLTAKKGERGNAAIEMTLVGIPVMFLLVCVFEISRAMWVYSTMAHAVSAGVRYAVVHGQNCVLTPPLTNNCSRTIGQLSTLIKNNGIGMEGDRTTLVFTAGNSTTTCVLNTCVSNATVWPPSGSNGIGRPLQIKASAPFRTGLAMLWPGQRVVSFAPFNVGATAGERVRF